MILQALNSYYERMVNDPESGMPLLGTSIENISFALVLDTDGNLKDVEDLREQDGKKLIPRKMNVPAAAKKASGIKANFLWDNTSYVIGLDDKENQERTDKCHVAFTELIKNTWTTEDPGLKAVIAFFDSSAKKVILSREDWPQICGTNLVFRLEGTPGFIHDRDVAREAWITKINDTQTTPTGQCLVTGRTNQPIARLHPAVKGVRNAQTAGASIVSFNKTAFESYRKEQSFNSPVSEQVAFKYTTALNSLLSRISRQKIQVGDTSIAFWAECSSPAENFFADLFDPPTESKTEDTSLDDQQTTGKIRGLLKAIREGKQVTDIHPDLDESVKFYILGLSPNAARLSIRFWEVNSIDNLLTRIGKHYEQLKIVPQFDSDPEFPPLWLLLCHTATFGKSENVSPVLAGGLTKAILTGSPYPQSLLPAVLGRIRAEHDVTYFRAALLKALLIRNKNMEVPVALNPDRTDLPYLLGRLFATLEKVQKDAIPGTNATIKERYLGSASATPGQIFSMLLKNSANHLSKLRKTPETTGRSTYYEIIIQDIVSQFADFPTTLSAEEQGLFMIGYYHQRKDFYTKKTEEV